MDRELRKLERAALQGDRHALYQLLIRKLALDDFDIKNIDKNLRKQLAIELTKSIDDDRERFYIYTDSDPSFYPSYFSLTECPKCGLTGQITDEEWEDGEETPFTIHQIGILSSDFNLSDDDSELHVNSNLGDSELHVWDTHISCNKCSASWRMPSDVEID